MKNNLPLNNDEIWMVESLRRDHNLVLYEESRVIHNKYAFILSVLYTQFLKNISPSDIIIHSHFAFAIISVLLFSYIIVNGKWVVKNAAILLWIFLFPAVCAIFDISNNNFYSLMYLLPIVGYIFTKKIRIKCNLKTLQDSDNQK